MGKKTIFRKMTLLLSGLVLIGSAYVVEAVRGDKEKEAFLEAARKGKLADLQEAARQAKAADSSFDLNFSKPGVRRTALNYAARYERTAIVKWLLEQHGINVDKAERDGKTPLIIALLKGNRKIVKLLMDAGAAVMEPKHEDGGSILHMLIQAELSDDINAAIRLLKENVQNFDELLLKPNTAGETPFWVAFLQTKRFFPALIDPEHKVFASRNKRGETVMQKATRDGKLDAIKAFVTFLKPLSSVFDTRTYFMQTVKDRAEDAPLHILARIGNDKSKEIAEFLISQDLADVTQQNAQKQSAYQVLHADAVEGFAELLDPSDDSVRIKVRGTAAKSKSGLGPEAQNGVALEVLSYQVAELAGL